MTSAPDVARRLIRLAAQEPGGEPMTALRLHKPLYSGSSRPRGRGTARTGNPRGATTTGPTTVAGATKRSRPPSSFPRPECAESGLWCRYQDGRASLLEVLFHIDIIPERINVRRALLRHLDRLPPWVANPGEKTDDPPWPIVEDGTVITRREFRAGGRGRSRRCVPPRGTLRLTCTLDPVGTVAQPIELCRRAERLHDQKRQQAHDQGHSQTHRRQTKSDGRPQLDDRAAELIDLIGVGPGEVRRHRTLLNTGACQSLGTNYRGWPCSSQRATAPCIPIAPARDSAGSPAPTSRTAPGST